jgi:hypothetical protein
VVIWDIEVLIVHLKIAGLAIGVTEEGMKEKIVDY